MSANYNGRRAPNVSQYLANLQPAPSGQNIPAAPNDFDLGGDLDFLTNAEFFDFDSFNTQGAQFPMADFSAYPGGMMASPTSITSPSTNLQGTYPHQPGHSASFQPGNVNTGDKRKASVGIGSAADLEEDSRMAAEEDKRRRNTAASARFRVKKKQREQALEKQAKDMTDKVQQLESKVQQLEMENKWLKELITEKSDAKIFDTPLSEKKIAEEDGERSNESRTDGVGTNAEVEA